ncbi:hypothetical protein VitviT2T_020513 [Vitis vinifera]|uniref:Uncharacterized protein n=1 Tax=Vitis vinifera TaxID=29760 RepID=A0ABY9D5U8_VITVI|nr:hypothetical protein VitviT2T_020513 [Vitis vinifera]
MEAVGGAALYSSSGVLFGMLTSSDVDEFARQNHFQTELEKLRKLQVRIVGVMNNAENKQMSKPLVKIWLDEAYRLMYVVDNMWDDFQALTRTKGRSQSTTKLAFAKPTTRLKNLGKRSDFLAFCPSLSFCLHFHGSFLESAVELRLPFGVIADIYGLFAKGKIPTFIDYLGTVVEKKTVVVSLWNDHATNVGQELLDNADKFPIVAIKSLKVGDFQVVSLSTSSERASMASIGSDISPSSKGGVRSMYYDRVSLSHVTSNPYLGEDKPSFFSIRAYISFIKPDQTMWYRACKTCNKKVIGAIGSGYWCEGCQKNDDECSLR